MAGAQGRPFPPSVLHPSFRFIILVFFSLTACASRAPLPPVDPSVSCMCPLLHTCIVQASAERSVRYTWGHGECGRLGHGIDQDVWSPRVVDELRRCGCHVTQVRNHATTSRWAPLVTLHPPLIKCQNIMYCSSLLTAFQCSMGHQHAAVKTGTGDVWIWGSGARGQLGLGSLSALGTSLPSKMPWPSSSAGSVVKVIPAALMLLPTPACY